MSSPPPGAPCSREGGHSLPRQLTSFVGRVKETAEVKDMLSEACLLTLTGSPGCGKSRLALQVAEELPEQFAGGVGLVELGRLTEPELLPQTVVAALDIREEAGRAPIDTLTDFLRNRQFLLVLDNCEHLVQACAEFAETLLRNCHQLSILATSREPLEVPGELIFRVPPLPYPDLRHLPPIEHLGEYAAARLFVERAVRSQPRFSLTPQNAAAVAQICRQLEGIPLAIELAAARARVLTAQEIAQGLGDMFQLLAGGSRTVLPQQQTLLATLDWSYNLLSERERRLLQRLAVFAGPWTRQDAGRVCSGEGVGEWELLNLLTELIDKSLVLPEEPPALGADGAGRAGVDDPRGDGDSCYRLLNTVRQYACDRLAKSEEEARVRSRHRDHYLRLAEEAEPHLRGPQQTAWLQLLEGEHDNLRAAMTWSLERGDAEAALRLGAALWYFWHRRCHYREGRERLDAALALPVSPECARMRARALNGAGGLADDQGEYERAVQYHEESLALAQASGDRETMAYALLSLGNVSVGKEQYHEAIAFYEQALSLWRDLGDERWIAIALNNLGWASQKIGSLETAIALYEESLTLNRKLGNKIGEVETLNNLSTIFLDQGDCERAAPLLAQSLHAAQQLDSARSVSVNLDNIARLAALRGDPMHATHMLIKVKQLCEETGAALPPDYEENVALVCAALGPAGLEAASSQAQTLALEQVITEALAICESGTQEAASSQAPGAPSTH